jgi:hypothetical protein
MSSFPEEYIEMINEMQDKNKRISSEDFAQGDEIYGIGPNFPSLLDNNYEMDDSLVPFGGNGGCYFCFDYRHDDSEAKIMYFDMEMDEEIMLFDTFNEYVHSLELYTDYFVIETNKGIGEFKTLAEDILNIEIKDSIYDVGYTNYMGKFNNQNFWISPNKVPDGFINKNDKRYEELKSAIVGMELRYPEIPESSILLQSEDEKSIGELLKKGIKIIGLKEYMK